MKAAYAFAIFLAGAAPLAATAQYEPYDAVPPAFEDAEAGPQEGAPAGEVSLDAFRDALAPYGTWSYVNGYGEVWQPSVAPGWRPYYYGKWVWTDAGWTWASEEPWGWGPYHYGRWGWDAARGWFWVPGFQWAPAWVSWRFSGSVVGWAPLLPGVSLYASASPALYPAWTFVPFGAFVGYPAYGHAYPVSAYASCFRQTLPAPPRAAPYGARSPAWGGPAPAFVAGRTGRPVVAAPVRSVAPPPARGGAPARLPAGPPAPSRAAAPAAPLGGGRAPLPGHAAATPFAPQPLPPAGGRAAAPYAAGRGTPSAQTPRYPFAAAPGRAMAPAGERPSFASPPAPGQASGAAARPSFAAAPMPGRAPAPSGAAPRPSFPGMAAPWGGGRHSRG